MSHDCCGKAQRLEALSGEDRREILKLRALLELLDDALHRLGEYDRVVIEAKMRLIERQHE